MEFNRISEARANREYKQERRVLAVGKVKNGKVQFVDIDPLDKSARANPDKEQVLISTDKWVKKLYELAEEANVRELIDVDLHGIYLGSQCIGTTYTEAYRHLEDMIAQH